MTHPADVQEILRQAAILVGTAEALGVTVLINPKLDILADGPRHLIDAWPAKKPPAITPE